MKVYLQGEKWEGWIPPGSVAQDVDGRWYAFPEGEAFSERAVELHGFDEWVAENEITFQLSPENECLFKLRWQDWD